VLKRVSAVPALYPALYPAPPFLLDNHFSYI